MLELRLRSADLDSEWEAVSSQWQAGRSYVAPYRHHALEYLSFTDGRRTALVVRERHKGAAYRDVAAIPAPRRVAGERYDGAVSAVKAWPLEYILIELGNGNETGVAITAGIWGTAPLFLLDGRDVLYGSWDPAKLYPRLGPSPFDLNLLAHFLLRLEWPYGRNTMFAQIKMLTERATARWGRRGQSAAPLRIEYPSATPMPWPRVVKEGADVIGTFETILRGALDRWLDREESTAVTELSGGLDSSTVSIAAAQMTRRPLRSYGLIMPGDVGVPQQERRRELAERFGFIDVNLPGADYPPLSGNSTRVRAPDIIPWEEFYAEAVAALLAGARQHNGIIFTGVGGDELSAPYYEEMSEEERAINRSVVAPDRDGPDAFCTDRVYDAYIEGQTQVELAPRGPILRADLEEAASVSTLYLRNGMWPVSPLATPELIWFCHTLPKEWRHGRALQRQFLAAKGCSRSVSHPQVPETFAPLMDLALRETARPLLLRLFEDSMLAAMGLVDQDRLLAAYRRYVGEGGRAYEEPIYAAAVMELTVRAVTRQEDGARDEDRRAGE